MATFVIGDVQGCYRSLRALVAATGFDAAADQLWFVGDLVNRGPRNLEVLRWVSALGTRAVTVLGNHDLHLLARAAGLRDARSRDTLQDVLDAPDADELVAWLRHRPLVHTAAGWTIVHAGFAPDWTAATVAILAQETAAQLQGPRWTDVLRHYQRRGSQGRGSHGGASERFDPALQGPRRAASALRVLTLSRMLQLDGSLEVEFNGSPEHAPPGTMPWYAHPDRRWDGGPIAFGHWAAHGLLVRDDLVALDTGCVWGEQLTALRLDDRAIFQVERTD